LIPFTAYIPPEERDKRLGEKLRKEADGILRWAVDGCLMWQREGLAPPDAVRAATEEYRQEMDVLNEFLEDRCIMQEGARVSNTALWAEYMSWCNKNKEQYPLSRRDFKQNLEKRNIFQKKSGIRYWDGIGLLIERTECEDGNFNNGTEKDDNSPY